MSRAIAMAMPAAAAAAAWLILSGVGLAADGSLKLSPCRQEGLEETVRCGDLLVPENPRRPDQRQIKLHVMVLPALDGQGKAAPLFELAGGPGAASTDAAGFYATAGRIHRKTRDIVLLDQRGTGESSPLRCPELELADPSASMYPAAAVRRCRLTLEKAADLSQFTTANAVADLDTVRSRLGYPKIDLFGLSYGTRLALAYMRSYPERVRSAVLIGTLPDGKKLPLWHARNAQSVLDALFEQCASDAPCHDAFPDLKREWEDLLRRVRLAPITTSATAGGHETPVTLPAGTFAEALRGMLYSASDQIGVPLLVHRMSRGDFAPLVDRVAGKTGFISEGLYLSITCAEDTPLITPDERESATAGTFLGTYRIDEQSGACRVWSVPRAPDPAWTAPRPDVPVLLIAGRLDAVTPPAWAKEVAGLLPRSRVLEIPGLGHFPDGLDHPECLDEVLASFYDSARPDRVDTSCIGRMTRPAFTLQ
jgi:pimeloyl-ACP methyl ester carboxylesterase